METLFSSSNYTADNSRQFFNHLHSKQPFKITKNTKSTICEQKLIEGHVLNSLGLLENLQNGKLPLLDF